MVEIGKEVRRRLKIVPAELAVLENWYYTYAIEHREWIKKQIELINPDIIIACGTFDELVKYTMEGDTRNCKQIAGTTQRRYDICIHSRNVPIIDSYYHPQYNKRNRELVDAMKEIRKDVLENL